MTKSVENTQKQTDPEISLSGSIPITMQYVDVSQVLVEDQVAQLSLAANLQRDPVKLDADINEPLMFRDCLHGIFAVVSSDYRYVPKDRAAYHAYRQLKSKSTSLDAWNAQQSYFDWLAENDPTAYLILDPVTSLHPDELFFEVFSKDEGCYAKFGFSRDALSINGDAVCGTTNIDFSEKFLHGIEEIRSYRKSHLQISNEHLQLKTEPGGKILEKKVNLPDAWIRGFLQVQTAAALPCDQFKLAPIDLYNILRYLRMHADKKGKRRGLRIELVPNEYPKIVLEPWEELIISSQQKYQGKTAKVIRLWGRRRLSLLQDVLPYAEEIEVSVLGNGLPSFWTLQSKHMNFTLGLTGFTSSNWSQALNFDLLLPRSVDDSDTSSNKLLNLIREVSYASIETLEQKLEMDRVSLLPVLQKACQQGWIMYDLGNRLYRFRPLIHIELDQHNLEYRNRQDREAHDLIKRKQAVTIQKESNIYNVGTEVTGNVAVTEDKREYQPFLLVNEEGSVSKASCTCPFYRKQKLVNGPCAHLIALRLYYAIETQKRLKDEESLNIIKTQTRSMSKRQGNDEEHIYYVTLDQHRLRLRWGSSGERFRLQSIQYNSTDEARDAYFGYITLLQNKGYLDLTAG